jgi:hypothetical protein
MRAHAIERQLRLLIEDTGLEKEGRRVLVGVVSVVGAQQDSRY